MYAPKFNKRPAAKPGRSGRHPWNKSVWRGSGAVVGSGPLPEGVRNQTERLFGYSFDDVNIKTNSNSVGDSNSPAVTIGTDIHVRANSLSMSSVQDRHYLGHELAHVVQNHSASRVNEPVAAGSEFERGLESEAHDAADSFAAKRPVAVIKERPRSALAPKHYLSDEHKKIGDEASGSQVVPLSHNPPYSLTFGDIVAMVGDYFASFDDMKKLAETQRGRTMLSFVRDVKVHGSMTRAQYLRLDKQAVEDAEDGFTALMANNQTHFLNATEDDIRRSPGNKRRDSQTGTPQSGAQAYRFYHEIALRTAYSAGESGLPLDLQAGLLDDAYGQEAGAGHYLTDAFSSGHVRTPRTDVKKYWEREWKNLGYKDFKTLFVDWAATQMAGHVNGLGIKHGVLVGALTKMFQTKHLDFGDLVSGVLHDYDNMAGVLVSVGEHRYQLYGDGYLGKSGNAGLDLAKTAVQAGMDELISIRKLALNEASFDLGNFGAAKEAIRNDGMYAAEHLMPEAVVRHSPFNWKADDSGKVMLSTMLATPEFQAGWGSLALKIVEEARAALDTNYAMFNSGHVPTGETTAMTEALTRAAANRFLNKLESDPMGSLLDILGAGPARLVIDPSELEEIDPDGFDPDAVDGPIDDGGGL